MNNYKKKYSIKWIYKQTKGTRSALLGLLISSIVLGFCNVGIALVFKSFIDIANGDSTTPFFQIILVTIALIITQGTFNLISSYTNKVAYSKTEIKLRSKLMTTINSSKLMSLQNYHTGELLTRLTNDITSISQCIPTIIKTIFFGILNAIIAIILLFYFSWKLAIIMCILTPILVLVMGAFSPIFQKNNKIDKQNEEENRTFMQEVLQKILLFKTYQMNSIINGKLKILYENKYKTTKKLGMIEGILGFLNNFLGMSMFIVAIGFGSYLASKGEIVVGSLIASIQLLNYILNPFFTISNTVSEINQSIASATRIGEILELDTETVNVQNTTNIDDITEINANNINFKYTKGINILHNVTTNFKKGTTGIIGKSGCGKSTLLKIIMQLYQPTSGEIIVNSTTKSLDNSIIKNQIAYVPSNNFIFSGTLKENICMNKPIDEHKIIDAAKKANIADFIDTLPDKYDSFIKESGNNLSSGQAQRIAIARAIYRDTQILIFDEPTANLDPKSTENFKQIISEISKDKICIIVTHDMSTINICDYVYVIEQGKIIKEGAPESVA